MIPLAKPQRMPSGASRRRMLFLLPALPIVFLSAWLTIFASQDGIVTVCPAGPPDCDYATIQAGIDAAGAGDTVVVHTGVYTEQVTLKSDVTLISNDGPDVTTIVANQAPVVSAEDVVSATLLGFSITGRDPITTLVGIDLVDSSLVISNTIIRDLHGMDAGANQPNGQDAIGIRVTGNSELIVSGSSIQDISGGNRPAQPDGRAGSAAGIWMEGRGSIAVTSTALRRVTGGDTGEGLTGVAECRAGPAGWAVGIHAEGRIDLEVNHAEITDLVGGITCSQFGVFCRMGPAGSVRGIEASDGTVALRSSTLTRFLSTTTDGIQPSYAVFTSRSRRTTLEANTITALSNLVSERSAGQSETVHPVLTAWHPEVLRSQQWLLWATTTYP